MEPSSYYGYARSPDDWYDEDDDAVEASKEAASALPAEAGDCSPTPNYCQPSSFRRQNELYEAEDYRQQKVCRPPLSRNDTFNCYLQIRNLHY